MPTAATVRVRPAADTFIRSPRPWSRRPPKSVPCATILRRARRCVRRAVGPGPASSILTNSFGSPARSSGICFRTARFHALFLPADHVSGDIYDVVRLDESHMAVSLADATGHGMPAALLTVLIKRSFRGKTIENGAYRIMEPGEVLANMNRDLLEMNLSHCQFVTALHAIYDEPARRLRWARGGLPHPVLARFDAEPVFVRTTGILLGAVESPCFDIGETSLRPGDAVYFYTDGLEALLCRHRAGENPVDISVCPWFRSLQGRRPADALAEIAELRRDTPPDAWPFDDISIVCVECAA